MSKPLTNPVLSFVAFTLALAGCEPSRSSTGGHAMHTPISAKPHPTAPVAGTPDAPTPGGARHVISFWTKAGPGRWFAKDAEFDRVFRETFFTQYAAAARGDLDAWAATPDGALALILLLDQYPRNAFRGTPRMYATDEKARTVADVAIRAGHDMAIPQPLRLFVYLPFGHSESLADQERSVDLARNLSDVDRSHAEGHRDIIRRFGRFPHRNPILGRRMRPEEQAFLDAGGFSG